jgi:FdhD protein
MASMSDASRRVEVLRIGRRRDVSGLDRVAVEEPLEVRLHGRPFAVIMRTPGADRELAAGFLFAERVLRSSDDLGTIEHCRRPADDGEAGPVENVVNVALVGRTTADLDAILSERRAVLANSSCGLCGRVSIDSLRPELPPPATGVSVTASVLASLSDQLRARQVLFEETGGVHAAGLFTLEGDLDICAEDVGRHNAVDKVVGRMLMADALPLARRVLQVSGRASYEIVQKAALAGIPIVASVSAPSSLAVELAAEAGVTLVCFVRDRAFNVYSHGDRVTGEVPPSTS